MPEHTYKVTEIVGSSADGIDAAIRSGIDRASGSLRHLGLVRGHRHPGPPRGRRVAHYQVTMKVGFRLDDD